MSQDVESLKAAFLARTGGASRADCPEAAEIWEAVAGQAPPPRLAQVVDHLSACPACRESWLLARELTEGSPQEEPQRNVSRFAASKRPAVWMWSAAAAVAAAVAVWVALPALRETHWLSDPNAPFRGSPSGELRSLVPESQLQPRSHLVLRWSPAAPGARYRVRVTTTTLTSLAGASDLEAPEYLVPEQSLAPLPSGATVLWQVSASLPDGRYITSPTFVARVR